jgi:hypothetical protein
LAIFWLKDESLEDSANLPPPDVIAGGKKVEVSQQILTDL